MRIILGHNFYNSKIPSGENQVFDTEHHLLTINGNVVESFTRYSDELSAKGWIGTIQGALSSTWNPWMAKAILRKISDFQPDIIHFHNTFPLISPSVFHAVGKRSARVLTLHNYRLFCSAAIPMRNGKVCTKCLDNNSPLPAMIYGCYRNSRIATLPISISVGLHRTIGTWTHEVDAFIVLSNFQRDLMIKAGLPSEKVHVKPNFYPGNPIVIPWSERKDYIVFAGRLTAEKGVINLLRAWQAWGANAPELRLVGDGELRSELEHMATGLPVRFLGRLTPEDTQAQIASSRLLILASECLETFGLVVVEAFAHGTPVAVSNLGPLPSIVQHGKNGFLFEPCNPTSLLHEVRTAWECQELLEYTGQGARIEFETKYTEEANYASLIEIYKQAIKVSRDG